MLRDLYDGRLSVLSNVASGEIAIQQSDFPPPDSDHCESKILNHDLPIN